MADAATVGAITSAIPGKEIATGLAKVRATEIEQDNKTRRQQIQSIERLSNIKQQEITKRQKNVAETLQVFRLASDEINNSLDVPIYEREWTKRGVKQRVRISILAAMFLAPIASDSQLGLNPAVASQLRLYGSYFGDLLSNTDLLTRTASAGQLSFTLNPTVPQTTDATIDGMEKVDQPHKSKPILPWDDMGGANEIAREAIMRDMDPVQAVRQWTKKWLGPIGTID